MDESRNPWFKPAYNDYRPDPTPEKTIHKDRNHLSFIAIGGTWCPDTHHLLPGFVKSMDQAGIAPSKVNFIGVDHDKLDSAGQHPYGATGIPVFIVNYDGKEIGRIIESVKKNIETDIADIITGYDEKLHP